MANFWLTNPFLGDILDGGDVEGDGHAEDGQDDRLVLLVHVDLELLHLALAGQLTRTAVADRGLPDLLFLLAAAALPDPAQRLLVHPRHQLLLVHLALLVRRSVLGPKAMEQF